METMVEKLRRWAGFGYGVEASEAMRGAAAELEYWQKDSADAWDRCEERRRENERLRDALRECMDELDAYYEAEYPGDHPYSIAKRVQAKATNPARLALQNTPCAPCAVGTEKPQTGPETGPKN